MAIESTKKLADYIGKDVSKLDKAKLDKQWANDLLAFTPELMKAFDLGLVGEVYAHETIEISDPDTVTPPDFPIFSYANLQL